MKYEFVMDLIQDIYDGRTIWYWDETSTNLWMWPQFVWWKSKSDFKYMIPSSRGSSVTTLGAISSEGDFYYRTDVRTNIETVMKLLEDMARDGVLKGTTIVMDRHRSHTNKTRVAVLVKESGGKILLTPPGCCELNPIEKLWAWVKLKWRKRLVTNPGVENADEAWMQDQIMSICAEAAETHLLIERLSMSHFPVLRQVIDENAGRPPPVGPV